MSDDAQLDSDSLADLIRTIRLVAFDFDGVFTDNMVFVFEDGREAVRCTRSDGIGLSKLKSLGLEVVIISTETNPVVGARSRKLQIECVQSCADKRAALEDLACGQKPFTEANSFRRKRFERCPVPGLGRAAYRRPGCPS